MTTVRSRVPTQRRRSAAGLTPERFPCDVQHSFLTAAALVVGAANLSAQTPNFAGTWTRIVDPNAPAMGGGGARRMR